ncbi:DUF3309 family protein [Arenibaculum sp.]|jgi:hypothetical protein|uniref:DUF3309 family protein n=1 Tax=Arenibaculum sp. TaxID=2865862 RepID=UPI002E108086|nr:DUF3309 family protein [Arenibaculum sp.]
MLGFWIPFLLLLVVIATMPWWPYSGRWGYGPGGLVIALLVVWLLMIWLGWVAWAWPWAAV